MRDQKEPGGKKKENQPRKSHKWGSADLGAGKRGGKNKRPMGGGMFSSRFS